MRQLKCVENRSTNSQVVITTSALFSLKQVCRPSNSRAETYASGELGFPLPQHPCIASAAAATLTTEQTDGQTDTKPMLYIARYGSGQRNAE